MRKKLLKSIPLLLLPLTLVSCGNKSYLTLPEEIDLFMGEKKESLESTIEISDFNQTSTTDHLLINKLTLSIKNISNKSKYIEASSYTVYGQDEELDLPVYSYFDSNNSDNNVYAVTDLVEIKPNDTANIDIIFTVVHGNTDANYSYSLNINGTDLMLNGYKRDEKNEAFCYIHDPRFNSKVLEDATYDLNAVFNFKPSETGSLKSYAAYDWCDEVSVFDYKATRINYIETNDLILFNLESRLKEENKSIEEIARACSAQRNQNRLDANDTPEALQAMKERNLEKYGNELGPTADSLFEKYQAQYPTYTANEVWNVVLQKSYTTNAGMDACCGVYDKYFELYGIK